MYFSLLHFLVQQQQFMCVTQLHAMYIFISKHLSWYNHLSVEYSCTSASYLNIQVLKKEKQVYVYQHIFVTQHKHTELQREENGCFVTVLYCFVSSGAVIQCSFCAQKALVHEEIISSLNVIVQLATVPTESSSQLQIRSLSHVSFHCIFSSPVHLVSGRQIGKIHLIFSCSGGSQCFLSSRNNPAEPSLGFDSRDPSSFSTPSLLFSLPLSLQSCLC